MNDERSFERWVADRIADDPSGIALPEDFYLAIDSQATKTRQHPRWLTLIKEPPMRLSSRVAVGSPPVRAAAVLVATIFLVTLTLSAGVAGQRLLEADDPIVVDQSGVGHFTTISEAVDAAEDGDTILVKPGRYVESVVVMGKDLNIEGEGDRDEIVIEAAAGILPVDFVPASGVGPPYIPTDIHAGETYAWAVLLVDTDTRLSGLTVVGPNVGAAIPVIGSGSMATLEDLVVRVPGPASGHWMSVNWTEGTAGTLTESVVEGWLAIGADTQVTIEKNALPATCLVAWETGADAVIRDNDLHGCPWEKGIDINRDNTALIEGNHIWVDDMPPEASFDGYSGGRPAIQVAGPEGSVTIRGNELYDSLYGIIVVDEGPELEIAANSIHDNGVGISGVDDQSVISANTISGNVTGVEIGFFADPTIEGNIISGNQVGLSIGGNSDPDLSGNTICGNDVSVLAPAGNQIDVPATETCEEETSG